MENRTNPKKINLIPADLAVSPKTVKLSKILNKYGVIGTISLFLVIATTVSIFIFYKLQATKISENINDLKAKITGLEASEQKLVITKDRLNKISMINSIESIKEDIINFQDIENVINSTPDSLLTEASIQNNKTEFSVVSKDSTSLSTFLVPLSKLKNYKSMILTSLGFSSTSGFISDLIINKQNDTK